MAQRRRRGEARLARMDAASIFGGEPRQVEHFNLNVASGRDHLARDLDETPRLRHLARTGVLGAGRAVDQEDAQGEALVLVTGLGRLHRLMRVVPVDGEIVVRVGEVRAGLAGARALARMRIGVPGGLGDLCQFILQRFERGILKLRAEAALELVFLKPRAWHALARLRSFPGLW